MSTPVTSAIDHEILTAKFACDLDRCKGACCTLPGGRGAPLDDAEVGEILRAFPVIQKYLPARALTVIERDGMVEGQPGSFHTTCIDDRDCVFVFSEGGVARCALEKGFLAGEIEFRKPISCHLFPLRVSPDGRRIRYERIDECAPAVKRGGSENVSLVAFLQGPLERRFGDSWYAEFRAASDDASTHVRS